MIFRWVLEVVAHQIHSCVLTPFTPSLRYNIACNLECLRLILRSKFSNYSFGNALHYVTVWRYVVLLKTACNAYRYTFRALVLLVLYLVLGVVVMKFVKHQEGTELIPHKSFWSDLPFKVKVSFLFHRQRGRSLLSVWQTYNLTVHLHCSLNQFHTLFITLQPSKCLLIRVNIPPKKAVTSLYCKVARWLTTVGSLAHYSSLTSSNSRLGSSLQ